MDKEKVTFKKKSKGQGKICHFCRKPAIWEALLNGSAMEPSNVAVQNTAEKKRKNMFRNNLSLI